MQAEQIAHDQGEFRFSIVEHEAAGVKLVVDMRAWERQEATDDLAAQFRCDVAGGRTRLERSISGMKGKGSGEQE